MTLESFRNGRYQTIRSLACAAFQKMIASRQRTERSDRDLEPSAQRCPKSKPWSCLRTISSGHQTVTGYSGLRIHTWSIAVVSVSASLTMQRNRRLAMCADGSRVFGATAHILYNYPYCDAINRDLVVEYSINMVFQLKFSGGMGA